MRTVIICGLIIVSLGTLNEIRNIMYYIIKCTYNGSKWRGRKKYMIYNNVRPVEIMRGVKR